MNPSTKLLLNEMRKLFAQQNAWLDRRFATSIAPMPVPSAMALVATAPAPAPSVATSVVPVPTPSAIDKPFCAAAFPPLSPSAINAIDHSDPSADQKFVQYSLDGNERSPMAATRTPCTIFFELAAPLHLADGDELVIHDGTIAGPIPASLRFLPGLRGVGLQGTSSFTSTLSPSLATTSTQPTPIVISVPLEVGDATPILSSLGAVSLMVSTAVLGKPAVLTLGASKVLDKMWSHLLHTTATVLEVSEAEDEVPSTLPNRPWPPPTDHWLVNCDAELRPLPWPSFKVVERIVVTVHPGRLWKSPWPIQIHQQIRCVLTDLAVLLEVPKHVLRLPLVVFAIPNKQSYTSVPSRLVSEEIQTYTLGTAPLVIDDSSKCYFCTFRLLDSRKDQKTFQMYALLKVPWSPHVGACSSVVLWFRVQQNCSVGLWSDFLESFQLHTWWYVCQMEQSFFTSLIVQGYAFTEMRLGSVNAPIMLQFILPIGENELPSAPFVEFELLGDFELLETWIARGDFVHPSVTAQSELHVLNYITSCCIHGGLVEPVRLLHLPHIELETKFHMTLLTQFSTTIQIWRTPTTLMISSLVFLGYLLDAQSMTLDVYWELLMLDMGLLTCIMGLSVSMVGCALIEEIKQQKYGGHFRCLLLEVTEQKFCVAEGKAKDHWQANQELLQQFLSSGPSCTEVLKIMLCYFELLSSDPGEADSLCRLLRTTAVHLPTFCIITKLFLFRYEALLDCNLTSVLVLGTVSAPTCLFKVSRNAYTTCCIELQPWPPPTILHEDGLYYHINTLVLAENSGLLLGVGKWGLLIPHAYMHKGVFLVDGEHVLVAATFAEIGAPRWAFPVVVWFPNWLCFLLALEATMAVTCIG